MHKRHFYMILHYFENFINTPWWIIFQIFGAKSSGPLYENSWYQFSNVWRDTWSPWERAQFVLHLYVFSDWLSDIWNIYDLVMHLCFYIAIILR